MKMESKLHTVQTVCDVGWVRQNVSEHGVSFITLPVSDA